MSVYVINIHWYLIIRVCLLYFLSFLGNREKWDQIMTTCLTLMLSIISDMSVLHYLTGTLFIDKNNKNAIIP